MNDDNLSFTGIDFDWSNPSTSTKLMVAVKNNDIKLVKKLLCLGKNPNIPDNQGVTAVHCACRSDDLLPILKLLLRYGGYIEHKTHSGFTTLCIAAYHGSLEVVKLLLKSGTSLDSKTNMKASAIHFACNGSSVDLVRHLHEAGADLEAQDLFMTTPLILAVKKGNLKICEYLLKVGNVSVTTSDANERTAFHYACNQDNVEVFNLLLKYSNITNINSVKMEDGWTLLMEAAQLGAIQIIDRLLELGAETSCVDDRGLLALHLAAHNSATCFSRLLKATRVSAINKYSKFNFHKSNHEFNSLPCLLFDKYLFDSLYELISTPGIDLEVFTCPVRNQDIIKSPIVLLMSARYAAHVDVIYKVIEMYIKFGIPVEPIYEVKHGTVLSVLDSLIVSHMSHYFALKECQCARIFKLLLENGAKPNESLDLKQNAYLNCFCRNGYIFGLACIIKYSIMLHPWSLLINFCDLMSNQEYSFTSLEIHTIQFLAKFSSSETLNTCKLILNNSDETNTEKINILKSYSQSISNLFHNHSLKDLSRIAVRNIIHKESDGNSQQFKKLIDSLCIPEPLIQYLCYKDIKLDEPNNFPSIM